MSISDLAYRVYGRRLAGQLAPDALPRHVGVIVDGNRRYAREKGLPSAAHGHEAGADKIPEFLEWCWELEIPYVTLWLLSTDNLSRDDEEIATLMDIIVRVVSRIATDPLTAERQLAITAVGALDLLPEQVRAGLKQACEVTANNHGGPKLQVAVGYGGRQEITDALRSLLVDRAGQGQTIEELAATLEAEDITEHLYTTGFPDPDLIIRTSGELRLSGFLLWQSAHSEFYFCDPYWPDFRRVDFLRALREYQLRGRRFGR